MFELQNEVIVIWNELKKSLTDFISTSLTIKVVLRRQKYFILAATKRLKSKNDLRKISTAKLSKMEPTV